jgi:hypothetical protein
MKLCFTRPRKPFGLQGKESLVKEKEPIASQKPFLLTQKSLGKNASQLVRRVFCISHAKSNLNIALLIL